MPTNLKEKTYRGAFWSAADAVGTRLVQFVIGVILARQLQPEQFGLIGMLAIFMAIGQSFLVSGFGSALIQKKEISPVDSSSVFYFNLVIGAILAGLLCLAAPWIAAFYEEPILLPMTRVMSVMFIINSFAVVQTAMLTRNIDFKVQAKVNLVASLGSGTIGVAMVYQGFGVWSLVAQQIASAILAAVMLWFINGWRPVLAFRIHSLRTMFSFGSRVLASGLINQVFNNIYNVVIGKLFDATVLGFYTRAKKLEDLPSITLTQVVTRVTYPVFSSIQDDAGRLKNGLRRALGMAVFIVFPVMIGLAVVAEPLVRVLLTDKWLPCVPYLRLLCVLGVFLPLHALNLNLLMAKGRSDLFLGLEIAKKSLTVLNIVITHRWGVMAMIWGQIITSVPCYYINAYYTAKLVQYPVAQQLRDLASYVICGTIMGAVVYAMQYLPLHSDLLLLILQVIVGLGSYVAMCGMLRLSAFEEGWAIVARRLPILRGRAARSG